MRRPFPMLCGIAAAALGAWGALAAERADEGAMGVLIYTRNGKGYVHDNIAACAAALEEICCAAGMRAETTDTASVFEPGRPQGVHVIVFANTNNEAFETEEQRGAFRHAFGAAPALSAFIRRRARSAAGHGTGN